MPDKLTDMQRDFEKVTAYVYRGYSSDGCQGTEDDIVLHKKIKAWLPGAEKLSNMVAQRDMLKGLISDAESNEDDMPKLVGRINAEIDTLTKAITKGEIV